VGGFHRYSVDERWLVPHFEKMLYDQAMISSVLVEAYQFTAKKELARAARETFDYVLRDMTNRAADFIPHKMRIRLFPRPVKWKEAILHFAYDELATELSADELKRLSEAYGVSPEEISKVANADSSIPRAYRPVKANLAMQNLRPSKFPSGENAIGFAQAL